MLVFSLCLFLLLYITVVEPKLNIVKFITQQNIRWRNKNSSLLVGPLLNAHNKSWSSGWKSGWCFFVVGCVDGSRDGHSVGSLELEVRVGFL